MAKRVKNTNAASLDPIHVFVTLVSFGATEEEPVSTADLAEELGVNPTEAFNVLNSLEDAELVDATGRGLTAEWFIAVPDVSEENAESIGREALSDFTPSDPEAPKKLTAKQQAYKERTQYNAAVSASQEEGGQHLHPMEYAEAIKEEAPATPDWVVEAMVENRKAQSPVIAEDGTKVTIPVDFDDPSKGRRELDAAKGERLISEDVIKVKPLGPMRPLAESFQDAPKPVRLPEIDGLDQFIDAETGDMVYESRIVKSGLALDEPSEVPPVPAGINPNVWDLAHTAITESARDSWMRQVNAVLHNQPANAPF